MTQNEEHTWIENLPPQPCAASDEEIHAISGWVNGANCAGLCSIGSGKGGVERRLGEANGIWQIIAADFNTWEVAEGEYVPGNVMSINLTPASPRTIYPVPANQALFIRYPVRTFWQWYLERYEGPLIIMLATHGSTSNPYSREEIEEILGDDWECLIDRNHSFVYRRL